MALIDPKLLRFWLRNRMNVLLEGEAGVGKTAIIRQTFEEMNLNWAYFSGSTLDPFVDFVGVPVKVEGENGPYIDLLRPKHLATGDINVIFIDEYNRCLTGDTVIPLADGTKPTIKELVGRDYFYVYSFDRSKSKTVIAKGHSARITIKNSPIYKVTLSNGKVVKATFDHPFLMRDGSYRWASKLQPGDSLMPFKTRFSEEKKLSLRGYEQIYQPEADAWDYSHRLADDFNIRHGRYTGDKGRVRHHIDFNKLNNSPENIMRLEWSEHKALHRSTGSNGGRQAHIDHPDLVSRTIGKRENQVKAQRNSAFTRQNSKSYKNLRSKLSRDHWDQNKRSKQASRCGLGWVNGQFNFDQKAAHRKRNMTMSIEFAQNRFGRLDFSEEQYVQALAERPCSGCLRGEKLHNTFGSFDAFKRLVLNGVDYNHSVVSVEAAGTDDVYDITVDETHNFALEAGCFVHNTHKKIRNATMELIQFGTINGMRLCPADKWYGVWVAINPDSNGDEGDYDTDRLDRAQKDRFQVQYKIPYECDTDYFVSKYGERNGKAAVDYWNGLTVEAKRLLSPRRLDFAMEMWQRDGDIRHVIPQECNPKSLSRILTAGPIGAKLARLYEDDLRDEAKAMLAEENAYNYSIKAILDNRKFMEFFLPCMPAEKLASLIAEERAVCNFVMEAVVKNPNNPMTASLREIAKADTNKKVAEKLRIILDKAGMPTASSGIKVYINSQAPLGYLAEMKTVASADSAQKIQSAYRNKAYKTLLNCMSPDLDIAGAWLGLTLASEVARTFSDRIPIQYPELISICNHCFITLMRNGIAIEEINSSMKEEQFQKIREYLRKSHAPTLTDLAQYIKEGNQPSLMV